ncbi:MAG TPA: hypothetical protein ENH59_03625 [Bacteroidetes bacterium]|nr:hypothetical protein [Bacteroidota bacterium]
MRIIYLALIITLLASCSVSEPGMQQDQLMVTRKYVGNLIDHRRVKGEGLLDPDVVWLKTTMESNYGKIGIYIKGELKLNINERLYIRRIHSDNPGIDQWSYFLESNNGEVYYRLHGALREQDVLFPKELF